jgi:hypothetical protein
MHPRQFLIRRRGFVCDGWGGMGGGGVDAAEEGGPGLRVRVLYVQSTVNCYSTTVPVQHRMHKPDARMYLMGKGGANNNT